ncbi:MAG: phosphoribosylglycinamide formyltransferase [Gemmatimonadetes bacterium]|nr:phosphoribosylglycinamide formyltransferase [Gemmatimonadota bacterium]
MTVPSSPSRPANIAVLASGGGSNLQSLLGHFAGPAAASARIAWVGSDREDAGALQRAARAGVPHGLVHAPLDGAAMCAQLQALEVDVVVLAGYLKLVPPEVVRAYHGRMLNIHPALLPSFGGPGMWGPRIHAAVLAHGARVTGATVHFVDEEFDRGPIVAQWPVPVLMADTVESLAARVLSVEHALYPPCVEAVATGALRLDANGRVVGRVGLAAAEKSGAVRFAVAQSSGPTSHELGAVFGPSFPQQP